MHQDLHCTSLGTLESFVPCLHQLLNIKFEQLFLLFSFGPKEKSRSARSQEAELTCSISRLSSSTDQSISLTFADPTKSRAHQTFSTTDIAVATESPAAMRNLRFQQNDSQKQRNIRALDVELSQRIVSSIRAAIIGSTYQKSSIEISILILDDDGCLSSSLSFF